MIGMRRIYNLGECIGARFPGARWVIRDNDYEQLTWEGPGDKPSLEQLLAIQVELEAEEPMRVVREIRDWYLKESDWTQVADLRAIRGKEWCDAWDNYRQQLRDFPSSGINPFFDQLNFLIGIEWPERPSIK